MQLQFTVYVLPLILAATGSAALAIFAWQRVEVTGATSFIWLMVVVSLWSSGNILEQGSVDLASKLFWSNVEYVGIAFTPVAWFVFAVIYTGPGKWLTRRAYAGLSIIPLLTIFFVWTNDWHGLMRTNIRLDASGPFTVVAKDYGPWFWIHAAYSYLLILCGGILLIQKIRRDAGLYRSQTAAILASVLVPWIGNLVYLSKAGPIPSLDLTPISFVFSGLTLAWAIFRLGLMDIVPAAHDAIVQGMSDGVIVFDTRDRVVDINPAALQITGRSAIDAVGQTPEQIFSTRLELVERYRRPSAVHEENVGGNGVTPRALDVRTLPLLNQRHQRVGQVMTLRDVTLRNQMEKEAREIEERAEQTRQENETLEQFRNVVANSPDTVLVLDLPARKATFLNREEFCGHVKSELETTESLLGAIHPDDLELLKQHWRQYSAANFDKMDPVECRVLKKDGEWEWIQGRATILERVPQGTPKKILFTLTTITERKQAEERLVYLSTHDALTGLYNRAFFQEELTRAGRGRQFPVSIVMADVNDLKKTNDNLGHAAGDETLRRAAQALRSVFRAEDLIARIGGDEFAVLLLNTDAAAAAIAVSRIRSSLVRLNASQGQLPVSLALGAGTVGEGNALSNALVEADALMYVDKSHYRRNAF